MDLPHKVCFPLAERPALSYRTTPRHFGAARSGGRKHAGCDLYAPEGTPVYAIADGTVRRAPAHFYQGTFAVEIEHPGIGIARYCEIAPVTAGVPALKEGDAVRAGQQIGAIGRMRAVTATMLHFQLYQGTGKGPLTDPSHTPYMRRADLQDPAPLLDALPVRQATAAVGA